MAEKGILTVADQKRLAPAAELKVWALHEPAYQFINAEVVDNSRVVATADIKRGQIVCVDFPIFSTKVIDQGENSHIPLFSALSLLAKDLAFVTLPILRSQLYPSKEAELQQAFRHLFKVSAEQSEEMLEDSAYKVYAVFQKNRFLRGDQFLLYEGASKFNHACRENCIWQFRGERIFFIAIFDIPRGQELTVNYFGSNYPEFESLSTTQERRAFILKQMYFLCTCDLCKANKDGSIQDTFQEMKKLGPMDTKALDQQIISLTKAKDPPEVGAVAKKMKRLGLTMPVLHMLLNFKKQKLVDWVSEKDWALSEGEKKIIAMAKFFEQGIKAGKLS